MKMAEPALSRALSLRGWLHAARRWMAPSPPALRPDGACAAPEPLRSAAPELPTRPAAADIAAEDWDLLFRGALELLARVAVERQVPAGTGVRLERPGAVLGECLDALDRLRRSVPTARDPPMRPAPPAESEAACGGPAPVPGFGR